jgi:hypothetical protein
MTAPRWDIPYGFYDTMAHGNKLVPAIHQDILLATVQQKLVPYP